MTDKPGTCPWCARQLLTATEKKTGVCQEHREAETAWLRVGGYTSRP